MSRGGARCAPGQGRVQVLQRLHAPIGLKQKATQFDAGLGTVVALFDQPPQILDGLVRPFGLARRGLDASQQACVVRKPRQRRLAKG